MNVPDVFNLRGILRTSLLLIYYYRKCVFTVFMKVICGEMSPEDKNVFGESDVAHSYSFITPKKKKS